MTRGKYGARAAKRQDEQATADQIIAYQHAIRRLTTERDEARGQLAAERTENAKTIRSLRAQIAEGTSGQVAALEHELRRLRGTVDDAQRDRKETRRNQTRIMNAVINYLKSIGLSGTEAVEVCITWAGEAWDKDLIIADGDVVTKARHNRTTNAQVRTIQAKNAQRGQQTPERLAKIRAIIAAGRGDE